MNKKRRKKLYRLIEKECRAEIMARLGPFWPESGDYASRSIRLKNKIWKLMFGTSNIVELGHKFGLPIDPPRRERVTKKKKERV